MRRIAIVLALLASCSVGLAQNLLLNPSFQDPAFCQIEIEGDVADGWLVILDRAGVAGGPRVFEFDTDGNVAAGNIQVDVSVSVDEDNAATGLANAIIADAVLPVDVATNDIGDPGSSPEVFLTWQGSGADGLENNTSQPTTGYVEFSTANVLVDGDTVTIDVETGTDRLYEFDTDGNVSAGAVLVDLSGGVDATNAANQLLTAVQSDALSPVSSASIVAGPHGPIVEMVYDGMDGDRAKVTNMDANDILFSGGFDGIVKVDDFNGACRNNTASILDWSGSNGERNAPIFTPHSCFDGQHASLLDLNDSIYQTVPGVSSANNYLLKGYWTIGDFSPTCTYTASLHSGADPAANEVAATSVVFDHEYPGGQFGWLPFAVIGAPNGTDTDMTVKLAQSDAGGNNRALHIAETSLEVTSCTAVPTISSFSPFFLLTDTVYADSVTITGSGFIPGETSVYLIGDVALSSADGWKDIMHATSVTVVNSTTLTCSFDIPDLGSQYYGVRAVAVETESCGGNVMLDAAYILPSGPLKNTSFELPNPGYNACPVQSQAAPFYWEFTELQGYGGFGLFRDKLPDPLTTPFMPSCPPPDGFHYAASYSDAGGSSNPSNFVFQTFDVTAGQQYTFAASFAGGGNNRVQMEMRDGTAAESLLADALIRDGGGSYDWTYGAITGTPTGDRMTIGWRINVTGDPPHATYADNVELLECNSSISVSAVAPTEGLNDGTIAITDLAGTGFAGTPEVLLVRPGFVVNATNVTVVSSSQISCEFDLTALPSGSYDIMVVQDGCIARLSDALSDFRVVATEFVNGSFEDPTADSKCGADLWGTPTGWNGNDDLHRDGSVWHPACDPLDVPDGVHYGSLHDGATGLQKAWQTINVTQGWTYRFGGQFTGGGPNAVTLKLIDGYETGSILAEKVIYNSNAVEPPDVYPWTYDEVVGTAASDTMTVMWEMNGGGGVPSASHADALVFEPVQTCSDPFADADGDGDVDQSDFAVIQACFTGSAGPVPSEPAYCICLNRNQDNAIDEQDMLAFEACASGPGVPADPSCD